MGRVRNLKILKGTIYAEVEIDGLDNGGWVTIKLKVAKGEDEAITAALAQLDEAVGGLADRNLGQVASNRVIDARVKDRLETEKKRHKEALAVQRKTLSQSFVEKLRFRARTYSGGPSAIDAEVANALQAVAESVQKDLEKSA